MIPKKIHYCWFGGSPLSDKAKECLDSWKRFFPDYEIIEWNENNFDVFGCDYSRQAYENKKWAFVSDYARFKILYENGGIYFDIDVEIIQDYSDIINSGPFFGCEIGPKNKCQINPGLCLGAEPQMPIYKEIVDKYNGLIFQHEDGKINLSTVVDYVMPIFIKHGFASTNSIQTIMNFTVYPPEYFSPMNMFTGEMIITKNTRSIHRYEGSWAGTEIQNLNNLRWKLVKIFGPKIGRFLYLFPRSVSIIRHEGIKGLLKRIK